MKNLLQAVIFLFPIALFACDCDDPTTTEKYIQSDFVARAEIVKNYENDNTEELYKADIKLIELFKGEALSSIYMAGRSDGEIGSSCAIFIPEDTELILYATKGEDGKYSVGMCSGLFYINNQNDKGQNRELDILKTLKNKGGPE